MSKTLGRVLGPVGLLLVFFGGFTRLFIPGDTAALSLAQVALGIAGIAFWGVTAFEDARQLATGRGTVFVVTSSVTLVALVGILAGGNYWVVHKHVEIDVTKNKLHTLADETVTLLKALTPATKVSVYAFYGAVEPEYAQTDEILRRYKGWGGENFEVEFIDPQKDPARTKAMGITSASARILFKCANGKSSRAKDASEEALTNALNELTKGADKKVYFLTGHGEKGIAGKGAETAIGLKAWTEGLLNEGYKSDELNLLSRKEVPADAQVLVVAGPQVALQQPEIDAIKKYADGGGRLVVMEDPGFDSGLEPLVASWGVSFLKGIVLDPDAQEPQLAMAVDFSDHPIATPKRSVLGTLAFVFPEARGLKKTAVTGYEVTELFKTSPSAWGENTPLDPNQPNQTATRDANDDVGPIVLADAVTHKMGDKELRAVVFGDSDFATNNAIRYGGNRDLTLNTIEWLAGQESKITIRPKTREKSTIANFTANQKLLLSFVSLQLMPLMLIAFGLTIWVVRRSK